MVIKKDGLFILEPENRPAQDAKKLLATLQALSGVHVSQRSAVKGESERIEKEISAIENGEAVANAKLQSALDALKPKHDYYEYS
jgi:hypothetical protein